MTNMMNSLVHTDFIQSPIENYIYLACSACTCIGDGIEVYPLSEYVIQSLFLNLTGSQEQKFKCICWDIASIDYEFRYDTYTANTLGECSNIEEKNKIVKRIVEKYSFVYDVNQKKAILNDAKNRFNLSINNSLFTKWMPQDYNGAIQIINQVEVKHILENCKLFVGNEKCDDVNGLLCFIYRNHLYKQRNRCAHNLKSYQDNLPSLKVMSDKNHKYNNYFIYFYILILIDVIIRDIYNRFLIQQSIPYV